MFLLGNTRMTDMPTNCVKISGLACCYEVQGIFMQVSFSQLLADVSDMLYCTKYSSWQHLIKHACG